MRSGLPTEVPYFWTISATAVKNLPTRRAAHGTEKLQDPLDDGPELGRLAADVHEAEMSSALIPARRGRTRSRGDPGLDAGRLGRFRLRLRLG